MLSTDLMKEIKILVYAFVCEMFSDMINPANRGPKFKWENFGHRTASLIQSHVDFLDLVDSSNIKKAKEYARKETLLLVKQMIDNAGLKDEKKETAFSLANKMAKNDCKTLVKILEEEEQ